MVIKLKIFTLGDANDTSYQIFKHKKYKEKMHLYIDTSIIHMSIPVFHDMETYFDQVDNLHFKSGINNKQCKSKNWDAVC